jgi:3-deoxy-D-manno-octulosonic-acid transferase
MRFIYSILYGVFLLATAPFYWVRMVRRGGWRDGFGQRFGRYDARLKQALTNRDVIWVHAVSVGEVNLCLRLLGEIERQLPHHKLVVSTTTSTGMAVLARHLPSHISRIYFPLDLRRTVQRAMMLLRPKAVVLVEAEIWPNFLWALQRRGTPYFLVNARISDRSFPRYRRLGFLFRPLFGGFSGVGVQSEVDARRMEALGCRPEAVQVTGSLKFEGAALSERRMLDAAGLLRQLGVGPDAPVLVGGSTHPGEEEILARTVLELRSRHPDLFLVVVPRHQERGREAGESLRRCGMKPMYRTEIHAGTSHEPGSVDALVVNTTGELRFFYEVADVVFVGKSLRVGGGQNPIEPASMGKPVVFGPRMENFPGVVPRFLEADAAVRVEDASGLIRACAELLADPERRRTMGERARQVVEAHQGGVERSVSMMASVIRSR